MSEMRELPVAFDDESWRSVPWWISLSTLQAIDHTRNLLEKAHTKVIKLDWRIFLHNWKIFDSSWNFVPQ